MKIQHVPESLRRIIGELAQMVDVEHDHTVGDALDRFAAEHLGTVKPQTARNYRMQLDAIRVELGEVALHQLSRSHVVALLAAHKAKPMWARDLVQRLRHVLRHASAWGWQVKDPTRGVRLPKRRKRERMLADDELAVLFVELARTARPKTYVAARLLALTGMRIGEVCALRWRDVDVKRSRLWVEDGKTGSRWVPIGEDALQLLEDWRSGRDVLSRRALRRGEEYEPPQSSDRVFLRLDPKTVRWAVGRASERAGIEKVVPHHLRHTFASRALLGGTPLHVVSALLGHSCPTVTLRTYAHVLAKGVRVAADVAAAGVTAALLGQGEQRDHVH